LAPGRAGPWEGGEQGRLPAERDAHQTDVLHGGQSRERTWSRPDATKGGARAPPFRVRNRCLRLGLPEDLADLVDGVQQLLSLRRVLRLLGQARLLRRVPEQLVELRVLLDMLGLEVVRPQPPQVPLDRSARSSLIASARIR